MRTVVLYARSPDWRAVVERADELMASVEFRVLKSEARTRAGFLDMPGAGPAFIKRVEVSSWSRGVYARVRGSRAARSLAGAAMLEARGFAHPEPLAAMDLYQAGAIRASYLVSRALINADSLSRFMLGPGEIKGRNVHRRKQISDAVAAQVRRLHESGLYTRDLQETNIMVEENQAGGFNVYSTEVEQAVLAHPAVLDCAVVGLPDDKWGERVTAIIQPLDGHDVTAEEIRAWVKDRLGSVKAPKQVEIWADLPRSRVGKILKADVKSRLLDG